MMNTNCFWSLALSAVFVCTCLHGIDAQTGPAAEGRKRDKKAIAADNRRDIDHLSDLIVRWDKLRKTSPRSTAFQQVETQITAVLRNDLKESAIETNLAKFEAKQSAKEIRHSRGDVKHEKLDQDRDRMALRNEKRDLKDDRKDLRDDIRDEKKTQEILDRKRAVAKELMSLQKQIDVPGKAGGKLLQPKQAALFEEYLSLSQQEIRLGIRKIAEIF